MYLEFPKTIQVVMDPNARSNEPDNLVAYGAVERAMLGESQFREVAEYRLIRVRKFRNEVVEIERKRKRKK